MGPQPPPARPAYAGANGAKLLTAAITLGAALAIGHPALALLAGSALTLTVAPVLPAAMANAGRYLLQSAIVLLGLTLNVQTLWHTSREYAGLIVIYVFGTLAAGFAIGRMLRTDTDQTRLLAAGTAICGGTTIATLAPIIRARPASIGVCLAIVFIMNAIAIVVLPWVGAWLGLSQEQFGVWAALAVHDTSSVVGTAAIYGDRALEVATTVKLARTLWLIPLVLVAGILMHRGEAKLRIPAFVLLFVLASVTGSIVSAPVEVTGALKHISQLLLVGALFFVGMQITRGTLKALNARALWLGVGLWALVLPLTLGAAVFW